MFSRGTLHNEGMHSSDPGSIYLGNDLGTERVPPSHGVSYRFRDLIDCILRSHVSCLLDRVLFFVPFSFLVSGNLINGLIGRRITIIIHITPARHCPGAYCPLPFFVLFSFSLPLIEHIHLSVPKPHIPCVLVRSLLRFLVLSHPSSLSLPLPCVLMTLGRGAQ